MGYLQVARANLTATPLEDGSILVGGGRVFLGGGTQYYSGLFERIQIE